METYYILVTLLVADIGHVQVSGTFRRSQRIESDRFMFYFDGGSGIFVGTNRLTCILVPLHKHEIDEVHTTNGIAEIELKLLKEWMGFLPEVLVLRSDPKLSRQILHWCDTKEIILLQRTGSSGSSTISPQQYPTSVVNTFSEVDRVSDIPSSKMSTSTFNANTTTGKGSTTSFQQMTLSSTQASLTETTTLEVQASATSPHARHTTTPSVFGPYVIYDKCSNGNMNAVVVDKAVCYVYHLTETDVQLVNMGSDIRGAFERALLSNERSHVIKNDLYIHGANVQIQQACRGNVFEFI